MCYQKCKPEPNVDPRTGLYIGQCNTCPFAHTDESEYVQNLGCLPEPHDIVKMKIESGHNWACHGDEDKICSGFVNHIKENHPELDTTTGNLISYDTWCHHGPEVAMKEADTKWPKQLTLTLEVQSQ